MLLSFNVLWKNCCKASIKLKFYSSIKPEFGPDSRGIPNNDSGTIRIGETLIPHSNVLQITQVYYLIRPEGGVEGLKMPYFDFSICYRAGKNEQDAKNGRLI